MPNQQNNNQNPEEEINVDLDLEAGGFGELESRDVRFNPELNTPTRPTKDPSLMSEEEIAQLAPGEQPVIDLETGELKAPPPVQTSTALGKSASAMPNDKVEAPTPTPKGQIKEDFANILKDVKLPERQERRTSGDVPVSQVTKPPTPPTSQQEGMELANTPTQEGEAPEAAILEETTITADGTKIEGTQNADETRTKRISSVHTLQDDLQNLVKGNKMSILKAASLEQDKQREAHRAERKVTPAQKRRRMRILWTMFAIVVLVGIGFLAFGAIALVMGQRAQNTSQIVSSLMFAEQTFAVSIDKQDRRAMIRELTQARQNINFTLGAITRVVPIIEDTDFESGAVSQRAATTKEFFDSLNTTAPEDVTRFFGDDFFLGIHTVDQNVPVLVVPIAGYERVFSGMLEWEPTINDDFAPFFARIPRTTRTIDGDIIPSEFEDVIIRNFDVRALKDPAGEIKMLYAFPSRGILIIAESPHSFVEALARLRAERRL